MRRLTVLMIFCSFTTFAFPQKQELNSSFNTASLNAGVALFAPRVAGYDAFPGVSGTYGKYIKLSNKNYLQLEFGLALPTLVTGKLGYLRQYHQLYWGLSMRPFPGTIGPHFLYRIDDTLTLGLSLEVNPFNESEGFNKIDHVLPELAFLADFSLKWFL